MGVLKGKRVGPAPERLRHPVNGAGALDDASSPTEAGGLPLLEEDELCADPTLAYVEAVRAGICGAHRAGRRLVRHPGTPPPGASEDCRRQTPTGAWPGGSASSATLEGPRCGSDPWPALQHPRSARSPHGWIGGWPPGSPSSVPTRSWSGPFLQDALRDLHVLHILRGTAPPSSRRGWWPGIRRARPSSEALSPDRASGHRRRGRVRDLATGGLDRAAALIAVGGSSTAVCRHPSA